MNLPSRYCTTPACPRSASSLPRNSTTTRPSISATTRSITAPAACRKPEEAELQAAALAAFKVTDCYGWGRVDFMRDRASGKFYFIEINTTPGMTEPQSGADGRAPGRLRLRGIGVAGAGNQLLQDAQMNLSFAMHRNRFKREQIQGGEAALQVAGVSCRTGALYARRGGVALGVGGRAERADLGARSAGAGDFDRRQLPARLARADRKGGRAVRQRRLHVGESRRHSARRRGAALGGPCAHRAPLAEQPARDRDRANRRGALGRVGAPQHARRVVRKRPRRMCPRNCRA